MKFSGKKHNTALRYASKLTLFISLIVVVFSPYVKIFETPVAQANIVCKVTSGPNKGLLTNESGSSCPQDTAPETDPATINNIQNGPKGDACPITDPGTCLTNVVYVFTVGLGSGLAYVSAFMLDTSIALSLNSAAYALTFLSEGWTTARDLANMAFILILVYIAFMIMFRAETARTLQMLALVVFIALIINFSFFFTRVVIDAGNILAVQFYNSIPGESLQHTMDATSASKNGITAGVAAGAANAVMPQGSLANTKDLTASIMNALNMQELFSDKSFKSFKDQSGFLSQLIILSFLYLMVGACYFILAAMFFAVSVKFIVRVAMLWFLIIASPLAFVCKAVPYKPEISSMYDKWQHNLISHAFYPAFFLFIFFFIATIMKEFGGTQGILGSLSTSLNAAASDPNLSGFIFIASAVANVGIRLGFVVAMLYIALRASEALGVMGGEMGHKVTGFAFGQAGRLVAGPMGYMGRNTVGRAGTAMASSSFLSSRAENAPTKFGRTVFGNLDRTSKSVGNTLGKASYDARNAPGAGLLKKGVEKVSGGAVSAGTPAAGGYIAQAKERAERIKKEQAERAKLISEAEVANTVKELIEKSEKLEIIESISRSGGTLTPAQTADRRALKTDVQKLANEFNGLSKGQTDSVKLADLEKVLKHSKEGIIKKIEESSKRTDKEKAAMRDKWENASVQHAQNMVKNLGQIHTDLTTHGAIPATSLIILKATTMPGTLIDDDQAKELLKELKKEIPLAHGRMTAATAPTDKDREKENIRVLQEARDYVSQMDIARKGIPDGKGGASKAGEFVVA